MGLEDLQAGVGLLVTAFVGGNANATTGEMNLSGTQLDPQPASDGDADGRPGPGLPGASIASS